MGIVNVGRLVLTEDELVLKTVNVAEKDALTGMTKGSLIFETEGIAMMFYDGVDWVYAYRPYTPQLYEFTSYTFKPIVNRGSSEGPSFSSMQATYAGQPFMTEGYFSQGNNLGYQLWTVPADGTYRITAGGARGGRDTNYGIADIWGASMRGDFDLLAGDTIEMCIGSGGNQYGSPHGNEAGGGGGTFVRNNTTGSVMIVAGGGGGSAGNVYGNSCTRNITNAYGQTSDTAAQTTCQGNYTVNSSTSGQGGTGAGQYWGGGGGGYVGDGSFWIYSLLSPVGGKSFGNGAVGGNGNHCYTPSGQGNRGGFGGGGGGNLSGPGGGGGYTGGNSSGYWSSYSQHGGGAGSFNNGQNQINTRGGNSSSAGGYSGAGYVTIQFL